MPAWMLVRLICALGLGGVVALILVHVFNVTDPAAMFGIGGLCGVASVLLFRPRRNDGQD